MIDIIPVPHCEHENCELGQLKLECPLCNSFILTCDNWFKYQDGEKELNFKCNSCKKDFILNRNDDWEWE